MHDRRVVHIEVQRTAKMLDQRYRSDLRFFSSESRFLDQLGREGPVHCLQHPTRGRTDKSEAFNRFSWPEE